MEEEKDIEFEELEDVSSGASAEEGLAPADLVKKLREKLKRALAEKQEYLDMSQRLRADYANLKREVESGRQEVIRYAKSDLLLELVELADTFELAFANKEAWMSVPENWRKGVEYIYSKLSAIFQQNSVEVLDPKGQAFDPAVHHSLMALDTDKPGEDNIITEVVQKGYRLHGRVIRPAQVKVAHYKN